MDFKTEQRILKAIAQKPQKPREIYYAFRSIGSVQLRKTLTALERIGEIEKVGERYRIAA